MNAAFACAGAAAATLAFWNVAARAAARRRIALGSLPPLLPVFVALAAYGAASAGVPAGAVAATSGAAVAGLVDARTGSIFDPLTAAIFATALALVAAGGAVPDGLYGAAVSGGALLLLHALSSGRGLGLGDVKLGTGIGMALGHTAGLTAIALAFIFGGAYGTWLLLTKRARAGTQVRFGPFIAAGTFAAIIVSLGHLP